MLKVKGGHPKDPIAEKEMHWMWRFDFIRKRTKVKIAELGSVKIEKSWNKNNGILKLNAGFKWTGSYAWWEIKHAWYLAKRERRSDCQTTIRFEYPNVEDISPQ